MKHIFDKIEDWSTRGLPFCVYKKPNSVEVVGVFQDSDKLNKTYEFSEKGFVFAPFDLSSGAILILPDEIIKESYQRIEKKESRSVFPREEGRAFHLKLVEKGLREIQSGKLEKVVLSRKIEVKTSKLPSEILLSLFERYPTAFCYLFFHPKIGTWCGATPENLLTINGKQFSTVSLAGTLPIEEGCPPKWTDKEREEQRMVTNYIKNELTPIMETISVQTVKTVQAGKLWHLQTLISGKLSRQTKLLSIVKSLHPTPAVCGIPKKGAMDFITKNEGYDRGFYTGFLGELRLEGEQEVSLFVNLRCMELNGTTARIFVGGGITTDSKPKHEWEETKSKSQTMLTTL